MIRNSCFRGSFFNTKYTKNTKTGALRPAMPDFVSQKNKGTEGFTAPLLFKGRPPKSGGRGSRFKILKLQTRRELLSEEFDDFVGGTVDDFFLGGVEDGFAAFAKELGGILEGGANDVEDFLND